MSEKANRDGSLHASLNTARPSKYLRTRFHIYLLEKYHVTNKVNCFKRRKHSKGGVSQEYYSTLFAVLHCLILPTSVLIDLQSIH